MFGKIFCGFFGGLMVTLFWGWALSPIFLFVPIRLIDSGSSVFFWGVWLLMMVLSVRADRTSRAWRRVLLISAGACFLMPISVIVSTGAAATQASTGIGISSILGVGGSALVASVIMVVFGIICLITGLIIGRKKIKSTD